MIVINEGRVVADGRIDDLTRDVEGGLEQVFSELTLNPVPVVGEVAP